ncbi:MAG: hypothetical protein FWH43_01000 [Endomicrobia bacterium]|nr:hypothetical protein [Endomicrobiia bacterium]
MTLRTANGRSSTVKINMIKKYICATLCFSIFVSFVCGDLSYAASSSAAARETYFQIPKAAGFISDASVFEDNQISVISVQDLHYNVSAQKNISSILENIEKQIGIDAIYAEGAAGEVDIGWIRDIGGDSLKQDVLDYLISSSQLTGYEYYAAAKDFGGRICGIEDESVYFENFLLLDRITGHKDETSRQLKNFNENINKTAASFVNGKKLDSLIKDNDEGKISQIKYYSALMKMYDKFRRGRSFLNIAGYYSERPFPNIESFIAYSQKMDKISKRKIEKQYAEFHNSIKNFLSYKEYKAYIESDDSSEKNLEYLEKYDLSQKYNEFFSYLTCLKNLKSIDVFELRSEEINLTGALRMSASDNVVKQDLAFIKDFSSYFNNFFNNSITFDDYTYFKENFKTFAALYSRYGGGDIPEFFIDNFDLFDKFISNNVLRNSVFAQKILNGAKEKGYKNIVLVSGGFHTEGLKEIFKDSGVNFITVTPNVNLSKDDQTVYDHNVKKQSGILNNAYALMPSSVLPEKEKQNIILSAAENVRDLMKDYPGQYNGKLKEIAEQIPILKSLEVKFETSENFKLIFTYVDGKIRKINLQNGEIENKTFLQKLKNLLPVFSGPNYTRDIFKTTLVFAAFLLFSNIYNVTLGMLLLAPVMVLLILPAIYALVLSVYIFKDSTPAPESQNYAAHIKEMPEGAQYLRQTTSIPVYNEPWPVIKRTLEYAIDARDRYNKKAGGQYANIVVSDDGLMIFADNDIDAALAAIELKKQNNLPLTEDESQIYDRVSFYREHDIGFIARPKHKTKTSWGEFERRGLFKKASNLNHSLMISKILEELVKEGMTQEDALKSLKEQLVNDKPIFENTYVSGDVAAGDVILLLDKDSTVPANGIVASMTEFVIDPALGYTQNQTVVNNPNNTKTSELRAHEGSLLWEYIVPYDARNGFVKFLGHNGFIRKTALEKSGLWSEDNVAEDFAMIMKMITMREETTGQNYRGKQIQYEHITFEELALLNIGQLLSYAGENNIALQETDFTYDEIIEKLSVFGYAKKEFNELLKTVKAQNTDPLKALNIMLNIYLESTMLFGEGMPEEPLEAIRQMSKFGYGTAELWLNPVKEWFKKGVFTPLYKGVLSLKHLGFFSKMNVTMGFILFLYPLIITLFVFAALLSPFPLFSAFFKLDFIPLMLFTMLAVNIPAVADIIKKNRGTDKSVWKALFPVLIEKAVLNVGVMHNSIIGTINRLRGVRQTFGATQIGREKITGENGTVKAEVKINVKKELKVQYRAGFIYFSGMASVLSAALYFSFPLTVFIILAGLGSLNVILTMLAPVYFNSSLRVTPISKKFRDNIAYYGNSARKTIYWLSQDGDFTPETALKLQKQGFNNAVIAINNSKEGKFLTKYGVAGIDAEFSISAAFENGVMRFFVKSSNENLTEKQKDEALKEALKNIKLLLCGSPFLSADKKSAAAVKKLYSQNNILDGVNFSDISFGDSMVLYDHQDGIYEPQAYAAALAQNKNKNVIAKFRIRDTKQIKRLLKKSVYDEIFLSVENDKITSAQIERLAKRLKNRYTGVSVSADFKPGREAFIAALAENKNIKNLVINYAGSSKEQILESLDVLAGIKQMQVFVRADPALSNDESFVSEIRNRGFSLFEDGFFDMNFENAGPGDLNNRINEALEINIGNIVFDMESFAKAAGRTNLAGQINLTRIDFDEMFNSDRAVVISADPENIPPALMPDAQIPDINAFTGTSNPNFVNALLQAA